MHLTPSDVNAEKTVMRSLRKHGFFEAEITRMKLRSDDSREKIMTDRQRTERRVQEITDHARMVNKAAGAYGTSTATYDEILAPHPSPITYPRVLVTPELATKLLELNTNNRPLRRADVDHWKSILLNGNYHYTHQGIALDVRPVLQDGQNRLKAIEESGISVLMMVSAGMPVANFPVLDVQRRRNYTDVLFRAGYHNATKLGSAARMLYLYDHRLVLPWNERVTNEQVEQVVAESVPLLGKAVNVGHEMYKTFRIITTPAAVGTYLLWREVGEEHPLVQEYIYGLRTGANMDEFDYRFALRRLVLNTSGRRDQAEHLALFLKTWRHFATGKKTSSTLRALVKWSKAEKMPDVYIPGSE